MAFPKHLLNPHEELILDLRPHWIFMFEPTISLIGAIVLGIILTNVHNSNTFVNGVLHLPAAFLILGVLCWFMYRYLKWVNTNFVVTTRRVVFRNGVVSKKGVEIPLDRINTVFFNQGVFERIIGAGDLGIESAGEGGRETFTDIRKPHLVQNEIYRQMEATTERTFGNLNRPPVAGELSIVEQLEKLEELRTRGVLSDAEFADKKAKLLDRM